MAAIDGKSVKLGNQKSSGAVNEGKWAGSDPPFPIGRGGEKEPRIILMRSDVGMYGTKKIKDEVD